MLEPVCFVHVPACGEANLLTATELFEAEQIAELLHTDVTERLCVAEANAGEKVLCYWIDARGGDRGLPLNFCGTCLYHTGCPVFGDILLGYANKDPMDSRIYGMSRAEAETILQEIQALTP